jgi:hypothetical protein
MMFLIFQRNYKFLILGTGFLFLLYPSFGQKRKPVPRDTIYLQKGSTLLIDKKKITAGKDTVVYVPQKKKYKIITKDEKFYQTLKNKVKNNFWLNELHNVIIISPSAKNKRDTSKTVAGIHDFIPYHLRPIRHITIKQLEVFGPTINDTSQTATSTLEKTGNRLHISTKQFIIKQNLFFKTGDLLSPSVMADNERHLRSLSYIEDAKFITKPCKNCGDSVDILVIVKDVWPKAFNIKIDDVNSGKVELWDRNLLGLGHEFQNNILWNSTKRPGMGYEGIYKINNIQNTFISGSLTYYNKFNTRLVGLNFDRRFFAPNVKYAGGLNFEHAKSEFAYRVNGFLTAAPVNYNHFEVWTGRSFLLNRKSTIFSSSKNLTFALKLKTDHFLERPPISRGAYYQLQNKKLCLLSTTYTQQTFFKSNYIYNFGRTEDIPVGAKFTFTLGKEFNEFVNRNYVDFTISSGRYFGNAGYVQSSLSFGTFFNKDNYEQGVLRTKVNYFTNLFVFGRFFFRQFVTFDYTQGINRLDYEYLTINQSNGIRGFRNDSIFGNRRIKMSWETVCFAPWKFYDFKMVIFLFADHSWIKANNIALFDWHPYTGIGFGFRFHNERLVFNIIQFRFTFYPNIPNGSSARFFNVSGETTLRPINFSPQAPDIVPFN